jgi:hypothetical protein
LIVFTITFAGSRIGTAATVGVIIAGQLVMAAVIDRFGLGPENATSYPAAGQLQLYPGGISETELLLPYGHCAFGSKAGSLAGNHFATVTQGLELLPRARWPLSLGGSQANPVHSPMTTGGSQGSSTATRDRASTQNPASTTGPTRSAKATVPTPKVPPSATPATSAVSSIAARTTPILLPVRTEPTSINVSRGPAPRSAPM